MAEPKFTRGPWTLDDDTIEPLVLGAMRNDGISPQVATVRIGLRETEANCRLIAAAPDLYEACRFIKNYLDRLENALPSDDPLKKLRREFHAPLHAKLDAALAKADGTEGTNG